MKKNKSRTLNSKKGISKLGKIWIAVFVLVFIAVGAFVIYRSFAATTGASVYNVPSTLYPGNSNNNVLTLKSYLTPTTGCIMANTNVYGATAVECVKDFQRKFKLQVDGIVGPATWSALFKVWAQVQEDSSAEWGYHGAAPTIISTLKGYGGAIIRVKCTSSDGVKHQKFNIKQVVDSRAIASGNCGTDGTAYVGTTVSTKGQITFQVESDDSANIVGAISDISWPTFVTFTF